MGTEQKSAICSRALNEDGELGTVRRLETQGVMPRMSVPQLANIDGQLLFVWTDKVDDQLQIKSRFVALDPI